MYLKWYIHCWCGEHSVAYHLATLAGLEILAWGCSGSANKYSLWFKLKWFIAICSLGCGMSFLRVVVACHEPSVTSLLVRVWAPYAFLGPLSEINDDSVQANTDVVLHSAKLSLMTSGCDRVSEGTPEGWHLGRHLFNASASSISLPGLYLMVKLYFCSCINILWNLGGGLARLVWCVNGLPRTYVLNHWQANTKANSYFCWHTWSHCQLASGWQTLLVDLLEQD